MNKYEKQVPRKQLKVPFRKVPPPPENILYKVLDCFIEENEIFQQRNMESELYTTEVSKFNTDRDATT